jgi:hypothetical protein
MDLSKNDVSNSIKDKFLKFFWLNVDVFSRSKMKTPQIFILDSCYLISRLLGCHQRPGLYAVGIFTIVLPGTAAKFIIKCLLSVLKFKGACPAGTKDWLCF